MANLTIKNKELILVDRNELVKALFNAYEAVESMRVIVADDLQKHDTFDKDADPGETFLKVRISETLKLATQDINKAVDLLGVRGEPKHKIL